MRRGERSLPNRRERGFTLLEVVVALGILAVSLGVLLEAQVSSLASAGRARDLTVASLLARAKMVDIEQRLFDEGFTLGDTEDEGDFTDEGHPEIKWKYKVMEVEIDLGELGGSSGGEEEGGEDADGFDVASLLGGMAAPLEGLTKQMGESLRMVELVVTWPAGRYTESMRVHSIVTRDDLGIANRADVAGGGFSPQLGEQPR